ncbi:MAG: cation:proton antiporter [Oscillospiraceae bacterium]|nr:cation:proton antiporter [Oscillospiraceae bacterium]
MLRGLYENILPADGLTPVIVAVAIMLLAGFLMTRVTKLLRLPNVTAYVVAGIVIGPFCLDLVPQSVLTGTRFLPDIALAFIAFSTGEYLRLSSLKKNGPKVALITLLEALAASVLVFCVLYFVLKLSFVFSVVLAALAAATAPASTVMTIRQTGSKGDFVDTLLQVVALDNVLGLLLYSAAISVALASLSGGRPDAGSVLMPIVKTLCMLVLGGLFGALMKLLIHKKRTTDNRLIIVIALLFAFCGICAALEISPLLGCMAMGTVYGNLAEDSSLFMQVNYFSPPILLLFFVRSGVSFDLSALFDPSGAIGATPLLIVGILYFVVRIAGKYLGAFAGCSITGKPPKVRNHLGLALIPAAGIAIGLAELGARTLGGETGSALHTIILASSVLYELIGPACGKLALRLSGSYSDKIEQLVEVEPEKPGGEPKSELEMLIERIRRIQAELPQREIDENEQAFTNAAQEHYEAMNSPRQFGRNRRR